MPYSDIRTRANATIGGTATVGEIATNATNKVVRSLQNTVARTNTTAKTLGTLPANAVIIDIKIIGTVGSDATSSATVSVGTGASTPTEYVNAASVKDAAGVGVVTITPTLGGVGSSAVTVRGKYAETGTAATTGGPWTVLITYTAA